MVTQLLFGEGFEILDAQPKWTKVQLHWDGYMGWIDSNTIHTASFSDIDEEEKNFFYCNDISAIVNSSFGKQVITLGSSLPQLKKNKLKLGAEEFSFEGTALNSSAIEHTEISIEELAKKYLNAPYLWGGRSIWGIDCSGFTQLVYKMLGEKLRRDAYQQADQGMLVNFVDEAHTGDLAFFNNEDGKIIHVGMVLSKNRIIHASGRVRIDVLDHYGIYNQQKKSYSHQLRFIKRIL
ncbi:hydrolase Nlp/P60 [Bacteroidota bacterium]|nr:hydrolase Nlp/P60 [Bacteroidota bacterium]